MKLYYFQFREKVNNFGDDLNPWLWERLLPNVFDDEKTVLFVGIGTLLNEYVPTARKTIVFGSGVGYGKGLPSIDSSWTVYCLRGPLSAKALGLDPDLAITDGALLLRRVYQPASPRKTQRFAYIPHVSNVMRGGVDWQRICEQAGMGFIDPRGSTEEVLAAISQTEVVLAEAMHGAIAADALRVPWIPVCTNTAILPFKWQDWCLTVGIEYQPCYVMPSQDLYRCGPGVRSSLGYWSKWAMQAPLQAIRQTRQADYQSVAAQLARIAKVSKPVLSEQRRSDELLARLDDKLQRFKDDLASGVWSEAREQSLRVRGRE
ncbi:MAG: polysaccharide pyruvyl transferase family protein [Oculatellaceae cyanobacterium bins.114]|nr:polysaccharide pyruvyl transferase family protein [Oculatellaceae cyanobacterium bins.114]